MDVSRYLYGLIHNYLLYVVGVHVRDIPRPRCLRPSNIRPSSAPQRLGWNAGRNSTWHPAQVETRCRFCDGKKDLTWGT